MRNLLFALMLTAAASIAADNAQPDLFPAPAPHWFRNARIIKFYFDPLKPFSEEELNRQMAELKANGVNVIELNNTSFQFVPGLSQPDRAQWKQQVNYATDEPLCRIAKKHGMRLMRHTTSTFVPKDAEEHPEYVPWLSLDLRTGRIAHRNPGQSYSDAVFMDMNSPGFRACIFPRMAEYARRCQIDMFKIDEVEWLPNVYAAGTLDGTIRLFREKYGELPKGQYTMKDIAWRRWVDFRYASGRDFYLVARAVLRTVNPEMEISGCLAGISKPWRNEWCTGNSAWLQGHTIGFFEMEEAGHPRKKKGGFMPASYAPFYYVESALYNAFAEVYGWKGVFTVAYPATYRRPDSEQFFTWALCSTMGHRYTMRGPHAELEWFAWEAAHEKDLVGPHRLGEIGVIYPEKAKNYTAQGWDYYYNWAGICEALAENNLVFDQVVEAHFLRPDLLKRFRVLVLPATPYLPPFAAQQLAKFAREGGTILVVGSVACSDPLNATPSIKHPLKGVLSSFPVTSTDYAPKAAEYGKGRIVFIPGLQGLPMHSVRGHKTNVFHETCDKPMRKRFADMVRGFLDGGPAIDVAGLPAKVLVNAFDTDGHDDGRLRRTVHILDYSPGHEEGDIIPDPNPPLVFTPIAKRNGGAPVTVTLRGFTARAARLLSPDRKENLPLKPVVKDGATTVAIPAAELGRYSILVCDP